MFALAAKWFLSRLLFFAWLFVTASPLLLLMWWIGDRKELRSALIWVTAPLGGVCIVASWWLGVATARHLVDEKRMFLDSVKWSLSDLRLLLAFFPIIGSWFMPDKDPAHQDEDEE